MNGIIFDPPLLTWPNVELMVGTTWDWDSPEFGGHFDYSVVSLSESLTVPAGSFEGLLRIQLVVTDSAGDTTQISNHYYAEGVGEVLNEGGSWSNEDMRFELTNYNVITSVKDEDSAPGAKVFQLYHNYPNPFNPQTTIGYSLLKRTDVVLIVYNLLGREVARFERGKQSAGRYQITWDASDLPSGIYFYRLQAGDFVRTRKMVLLK